MNVSVCVNMSVSESVSINVNASVLYVCLVWLYECVNVSV